MSLQKGGNACQRQSTDRHDGFARGKLARYGPTTRCSGMAMMMGGVVKLDQAGQSFWPVLPTRDDEEAARPRETDRWRSLSVERLSGALPSGKCTLGATTEGGGGRRKLLRQQFAPFPPFFIIFFESRGLIADGKPLFAEKRLAMSRMPSS